jgi:hypothetical protein
MTCQNATIHCDTCGREVCQRCARCSERIPVRPSGTWRERCPSRWCRYIKLFKAVVR